MSEQQLQELHMSNAITRLQKELASAHAECARLEAARADLMRAYNERGEALRELQAVKAWIQAIFADPRYRNGWTEAEICTRLLAALNPWWEEYTSNG